MSRPGLGQSASQRGRNALGHLKRTFLCENLQQSSRRRLCAGLRSRNARNARGHVTSAISHENLQEKRRKQDGAP